MSADGKTMTWKYMFNCPVTKKPTPMRQVETTTGPGTKTLEMFGRPQERQGIQDDEDRVHEEEGRRRAGVELTAA